MVTRVININHGQRYDVYIGRPSIWGNPYSHLPGTLAEHRVANRLEAIQCYEAWIMGQPELLAQIATLKGKILGCWCKPYACHGEVLVRLAEW